MSFLTIQQDIGQNTLLYDSVNGWKTNRDVTQSDIKNIINQIYREELFPLFSNQAAFDFRMTAQANSWIANGTASAGLNSTTLTTTTSVFNNSMVGLYIWNDTTSTTAKITSYNGATSVVTDTDMTTWSNQPVYVLGQQFSFGGDASDFYTVESVGIKYSSADQYYRQATLRSEFDFYQEGSEIAIKTYPIFYLTNMNVSGVSKYGIGLLPQFDTKLTNAIQITYLAKPATLVNDDDTTKLPVDLMLTYGGIARVYMQMQDLQSASVWEQKYMKMQMEAVQRYNPVSVNTPQVPRLPRRYGLMKRRRI